MRLLTTTLLVLVCAVTGFAQATAGAASSDIRALLEKQVQEWNRGNIEGFMQTYWKSDHTVFVGANGVTRGWQAVLERYKKSYPDRRTMGTLTFSDLDVNLLSHDAAVVLGHWQLKRDADAPAGYFTLIVRKLPEGWRIVHDHSSAVAQQNRQ